MYVNIHIYMSYVYTEEFKETHGDDHHKSGEVHPNPGVCAPRGSEGEGEGELM